MLTIILVPLLAFLGTEVAESSDATHAPTVLVVVGAAGTEEYGKQFRAWAERWNQAAARGGASFAVIGLDDEADGDDRAALKSKLDEERDRAGTPLWLVLIGHGTFDGKTTKFNLRGPDVTAGELAEWLAGSQRPLAAIDCTSASGPFINSLSAPGRVVITATKSGFEQNFARFGEYLSAAIADPKADLDKDDQTSLLEAFLLAAAGVKEFYDSDARLATEHALIDDNGDGLGTPADWFHGVRATKAAKDGAALDGLLASQFQLVASGGERRLSAAARQRRDEIETAIARLRQQKNQLSEDDYFSQLETLLVEMAGLYQDE